MIALVTCGRRRCEVDCDWPPSRSDVQRALHDLRIGTDEERSRVGLRMESRGQGVIYVYAAIRKTTLLLVFSK
jgi:hypothetical protein